MKSHSHPATGQDLWVVSKNYAPGTFCELGAFDGVTHSNTLLLEKLGWAGTLIEAHAPFWVLCEANRPQANCINAAIGDKDGAGMLMVGGPYTGLAKTMPKEFIDEHVKRCNHSYRVQTFPLFDFVQSVDYLSVDTEGGEYEILKNWLESGGQARLMTVEFRYDKVELYRIERLADEHGYQLDEIRGFDLCLIRKT
jgi:FkbM family methyltransferase